MTTARSQTQNGYTLHRAGRVRETENNRISDAPARQQQKEVLSGQYSSGTVLQLTSVLAAVLIDSAD
jgi:hypothetical protein